MGIILDPGTLRILEKPQNRLLFKQNYWQNIPKLLIKKPTCFKIGFLGILGFGVKF